MTRNPLSRAVCAWIAIAGALGGALGSAAAHAQNAVGPSGDWAGNWGFSTPAQQTARLLQSDLIEKKESGYYDSLGRQEITINNNYDYSSGNISVTSGDGAYIDVDSHYGDDIGQNTNVIGAVDASTTTIDISGDDNSVNTSNQANSTGCQNGSVNIDSPGTASAPSGCN